MLAKLLVDKREKSLRHGCKSLAYPSDDEIANIVKNLCATEKLSIDDGVEISAAADIIEFSRGDEDLGICLYGKFANYVRKQLDKESDNVEIVEADIVQTKSEQSDRGCQYCKKDAKPLLEYKETEAYEIYIEENELVFAAPVASVSRIKINFCPKCGRPLENEHEA